MLVNIDAITSISYSGNGRDVNSSPCPSEDGPEGALLLR